MIIVSSYPNTRLIVFFCPFSLDIWIVRNASIWIEKYGKRVQRVFFESTLCDLVVLSKSHPIFRSNIYFFVVQIIFSRVVAQNRGYTFDDWKRMKKNMFLCLFELDAPKTPWGESTACDLLVLSKTHRFFLPNTVFLNGLDHIFNILRHRSRGIPSVIGETHEKNMFFVFV